MDILIISRGVPTPSYPMNGLFEWDQARALQAAGQRVILGAVDARSIRHPRAWGWESVVQDGIPVEVLHLPAGRLPPDLLQTVNARAIKSLYRQVLRRHGTPQVIHSHFLRMGTGTMRALKDKGIPMVHTEHYSGLNRDPLSPRLLRWGREVYPRFQQVIAVSHALARRLEEKFAIQARVIPNPVDLDLFTGPGVPDPGFHFVSTGHLLPHKRMDLLIRGFQQAFGDDTEVTLTLLGEGSERERLTGLIQQGSGSERIILAGHRPRGEVAARLQKSHVFTLLSEKETFGLAYVEALACGLPVLAAQSGGPEDFIRPDTGRLITDMTVAGVAVALKAMKEEYGRYDSVAIARFAQETFSPAAVAAQLLAVYKQVTTDREPREGDSL